MFFPKVQETIGQRNKELSHAGIKNRRVLGLVAGALTVAFASAVAPDTLSGDAIAQTLAQTPVQTPVQTIAQASRLPARDPQQVPTARYGRGEAVDLSLIVEEWRDRYPAIPVYTCSCTTDACGDDTVWPFRTFTRYQPFVALGAFNATNSEETGFNCFDIETSDRPQETQQ
ncbi:MAG: hypothetical protein ACFB0D_11190 [Phormidesmis sp.]